MSSPAAMPAPRPAGPAPFKTMDIDKARGMACLYSIAIICILGCATSG